MAIIDRNSGKVINVAEFNKHAAVVRASGAGSGAGSGSGSGKYALAPDQRKCGEVVPIDEGKCSAANVYWVGDERDEMTEQRTGWRQYKCAGGHVFWDRRTPSQIKYCRQCSAASGGVAGKDVRGVPLKYDLAGQVFGKLIARKHVGAGQWLCECACGGSKTVAGQSLRLKMVKSCGSCRTAKRGDGSVAMVQITGEAKKQLRRAHRLEQRPMIDLASEAIEAVWGALQE